MNQLGKECDEQGQAAAVKEIGPAGPCTVVDVRRGTDDLGDHGQAPHGPGKKVADAHRGQVAIEIRIALPGVELVHRRRAEEQVIDALKRQMAPR